VLARLWRSNPIVVGSYVRLYEGKLYDGKYDREDAAGRQEQELSARDRSG